MEPAPKSAVVTGSRRGLGQFISERLLDQGYRVFGCSRGACEWKRDGYTHVQADIADPTQVSNLFSQVRRDVGRLDVLINNAAIASMNHSILVPDETVQRVMQVNFCGAFFAAREATKLMRRTGLGRIVNLTTVAVPLRLEGEAVYAASKSALEMMTRVLAHELAAFRVTVNAVGPSPVDTQLIRGVPKAALSRLMNRLPLKEMSKPEDVMNVVDFFLRRESACVTGQVVYLGGAG